MDFTEWRTILRNTRSSRSASCLKYKQDLAVLVLAKLCQIFPVVRKARHDVYRHVALAGAKPVTNQSPSWPLAYL